ncbi:MAG: acyltransferase [Oligoflexia bacterium]|nr:acyltransferase [Oligoflexia bacterium]
MRKLHPLSIVIAMVLMNLGALSGILLVAWTVAPWLPSSDFRGLILTALAALSSLAGVLAAYRLFLAVFPLKVGEVSEDFGTVFRYEVHQVFYLMIFTQLVRSNLLPVPLLRLLQLALGATMGENSYFGGVVYDPTFVEVGKNTLTGDGSLLTPHMIEGKRLAYYPIRIGSDVTIGARAIILAGVTIGNNSIVGTGSVVTKGTVIGDNEIWAGTPARFIRKNLPSSPVAAKDKNRREKETPRHQELDLI